MIENAVTLRRVKKADLRVFYEQQRDPAANQMAAFGAKDPEDWQAFSKKWSTILGEQTITVRTILFEQQIAGQILTHVASWSGQPEVSYWLGRTYWGQGIATQALTQFLALVTIRPLYARAATDNIASLRVLSKCGFRRVGLDKGFANARGSVIEEVVFRLTD